MRLKRLAQYFERTVVHWCTTFSDDLPATGIHK